MAEGDFWGDTVLGGDFSAALGGVEYCKCASLGGDCEYAAYGDCGGDCEYAAYGDCGDVEAKAGEAAAYEEETGD